MLINQIASLFTPQLSAPLKKTDHAAPAQNTPQIQDTVSISDEAKIAGLIKNAEFPAKAYREYQAGKHPNRPFIEKVPPEIMKIDGVGIGEPVIFGLGKNLAEPWNQATSTLDNETKARLELQMFHLPAMTEIHFRSGQDPYSKPDFRLDNYVREQAEKLSGSSNFAGIDITSMMNDFLNLVDSGSRQAPEAKFA